MTFGELMRVLRQAAGLTLGDLAREMDWGVVHVSNLERGVELPPTQVDIRRLAKVLGTDDRALLRLAERAEKLSEDPDAFTIRTTPAVPTMAIRLRAILLQMEAAGSLGAAIKIRLGTHEGSLRVSLSFERPLESPADVYVELEPNLARDDWATIVARLEWFSNKVLWGREEAASP